MKPDIRNYNPAMSYRRFGKTEQYLSVITLGGMRYIDGWSEPRETIGEDMIDQCVDLCQLSFAAGINHIETAHGYGRSERCYGIALNERLKQPRNTYHLMTKGSADSASDMRATVEKQLKDLQTDHIDLYGWHGINTPEKMKNACRKGGSVEELLKMKDEGMIGSVGFSTHAALDVIIDSIHTDLFSFVNLHYYYFFQRNRGAVDYAGSKDMGVFIISPNDKGGKLYDSSQKLKDLCKPLTPIQFNARWCLKNPEIHTLSFGMTQKSHVDEMRGICPVTAPLSKADLEIEVRMNAAILADPDSAYEGYELSRDASGINIPEILRQRRMVKCYDQKSFGDMRYNMFESKGDWFPGEYAMPDLVAKIDTSKSSTKLDVKRLITETHDALFVPRS
jgi:predicted aldo/keto reductase-like oxidoreductase